MIRQWAPSFARKQENLPFFDTAIFLICKSLPVPLLDKVVLSYCTSKNNLAPMQEIGISTVLNEINQPVKGVDVHTFSITFIRTNDSKNGEKGEEKVVSRCQKYSKNPSRSGAKKIRQNFNYRENSTLLLTDLSTGHPIHVKTWSIIEYNRFKVRH